ncbi:MAG: PQQ-binding-like beta-propeller repeat protein [Candidatus Bathyarchaeota archaeon]|nr:PQQ-binding-like beta-propeller repeat protein [Candidatus Bathyarchaeota archaeon]
MKIKQNFKQTLISTTVIALMLLSMIALNVPSTSAADYPTYLFLTAQPNPIGVGQDANVVYWMDRAPPTASGPRGDRWQGWKMEITSPDGKTETKDLPASDAAGSGIIKYVPTQVGNYTFKMTFPGQNITQGSVINWYKPSESATIQLTVQEEQIQLLPYNPLPTDYWSRPINAANYGWNQLASNWLAAGSAGPHGPRCYDSNGNFNPYGTAPDSPHVMWTKEIAFGGIVGESTEDTNYFPGETYDRKFQPPIIMDGRLYYNQRLGVAGWQGLYCIDLQTGEEIWFKNGTTVTFGQLLNWQTPNVHGIIPHLWSVSGTTYKMYDAFTGDWILDVQNVPSGTMIYGENGEILIYTLSGATNILTLWNSSKALEATMSGDWYYRPVGPVNGTKGYEWNVTVPDIAGTQSLLKIKDGIIYARATYTDGAPGTTKVGDVGYDISFDTIKKDDSGKYPTSINNLWGPVNRTFEGTLLNGFIDSNILPTFVKEKMVWYGINVRTGAIAWGPTQPYENAWGVYQPYADWQSANGILYAAGYDGMIHAYNITTGANIWNWYTDSSGLETVYGHYVFKDSAMSICDGKLYAVNNEHSPSTPLYRGSKMYCIDAVTGQTLWNISFWGLFPVIADGYAVSFNYYDGLVYCFGKGESETTITTSPKVSTLGSSVLIEGKVIDKTSSADGAAVVSDTSMASWMEYLYMQQPKPTNATGVTVTLDIIDANGNYRNIGEVTTDLTGAYSYAWQPDIPGKYTIIASYSGSNSYGSSGAETAIQVDEVPPPSTTPIAETAQPMTDTYVLAVGAAIIVAIAIIGAIIISMLKKRP